MKNPKGAGESKENAECKGNLITNQGVSYYPGIMLNNERVNAGLCLHVMMSSEKKNPAIG